MNETTKQEIISMRKQGMGYMKIGQLLGISHNTVRSFCSRNRIGLSSNTVNCKECGKVIKVAPKHKSKKFCSDSCRIKWWNSNQDKVNKKAVYEFACAYCGVEFTAYGNNKRKYCSHACYIKARYRGGGACDE